MAAPKGNQYAKGLENSGCPPMYKNVEEMQLLIDDYFKVCEGEILKDKDGNPMLTKNNEAIFINKKPLTVTGMALHLGFTSRQALLNYQAKKEFVDSITRAKSFIEQYAESRLYDREGCNGAKFALANNYGWREKQELDISGDVTINVTIDE